MARKQPAFLVLALLCCSALANAQSRILFYFDKPVNTSVSTTINANYVGNSMADTIVSYINKAQTTLDVAQYEYIQNGNYANIATAINNAYNRGVKVRYIYDGSATNSGMNALNSNIHTLASPTTGSYGIMHNKFIVIDANSSATTDAWVISGSPDWNSTMFTSDYNNLVAIQDQALAQAYTAEFNMMWGGSGSTTNAANSKFGPHKTDLGLHNFTIDGHLVELYFSPSDNTDSHIQSVISTANTDLYFGMYTFTEATDASLIVQRKNAGVYVAGIDDSYSNSYAPYTTFTNGLGSNFKVYNGGSSIYHNKFLIVDPSDVCSDPLVLTGSHNWTTSANTLNDENTLIIHSDTAANIYYQAFYSDFVSLGGTLTQVTNCASSVPELNNNKYKVSAYPNPANKAFYISYSLPRTENVIITITDMLGRVAEGGQYKGIENPGTHTKYFSLPANGIYLWTLKINDAIVKGKIVSW